MKKGKPTMGDVAKQAGVSPATVARVIYKNGYVKEKTRIAVEEAVAQTGYSPDIIARGLRTNRSHTIGLVLSESRINTFQNSVAHVVQMEAVRYGYSVLTFNNQMRRDIESIGARRLLAQRVDAVIFCSAVDPVNVRAVNDSGTPVVQIEREVAKGGIVIAIDPEAGMRKAIDYLYRLGHRTFAFIGGQHDTYLFEGPASEIVEARRERTFKDLLARHGITVPEKYVLKGDYLSDDKKSPQPGYFMMTTLLQLTPRPTAVICGSDLLAASAVQAITKAGLNVPGDVSVVGFDDEIAEFLTPPLSSIAQPAKAIGEMAVALALDAIEGRREGDLKKTLDTDFVCRDSTASIVHVE